MEDKIFNSLFGNNDTGCNYENNSSNNLNNNSNNPANNSEHSENVAGNSSTNNQTGGSCGISESAMSMPQMHCMGYGHVPWQMLGDVYKPENGLEAGTIFPELELTIDEYGKICKGGM